MKTLLNLALASVLFAGQLCATESDPKTAQEIEHVGKLIKSARELREKYQQDPHRPKYHLMGPEDYCCAFDPQGCIYWKGRYHVFYPYFPEEGGVWGHVSSADLVHWTYHPKALGISPGDREKHVFAGGSFVNREGVLTLIYHGVGAGTCIATSRDDGLIHWTKHPANPVIPIPKQGDPQYGKYVMWDACGWVDGDFCCSLSGGNTKEDGDIAWLFRSRDMVHWEYLHPFYKSDRRWTGAEEACSCPDFFPLGNKHVLMFISHSRGWSDVYTMPRVLSLAKDGSLQIEPAEELNTLRYDHRRHETLKIAADSELVLNDVSGDCLELSLEVDPAGLKEFGIKVRCSPSGEEHTTIRFDPSAKSLTVDATRSTLSKDVVQTWPNPHLTFFTDTPLDGGRKDVRIQVAPFELSAGEPLKLRIFLDRSMLEVFANSRQCVTQRIYPARSDSVGVVLFSRGGGATVRQLDAWKMSASNPW